MDRLTEDDIIDVLAHSMVELHGNELLTKITEMATDLTRYKNLEERLGFDLEEAINILFLGLQHTELYPCLTCTNNMHNDFGCDGSCSHDREFTQAEILSMLKKRLEHSTSK